MARVLSDRKKREQAQWASLLEGQSDRPSGVEKTKRSGAFPRAVRKRDNMTCQKCGNRLAKLHAHHIIPLDEGGPDTPENGILLCSRCHIEWEGVYKALDFDEWMKLPTAIELLATFLNEQAWRSDLSAADMRASIQHAHDVMKAVRANEVRPGEPEYEAVEEESAEIEALLGL